MKVRFRILATFLFAGMALASDVRVMEQIAAKVNGEIVTTGELARTRKQLNGELRQQGLSGEKLEAEIALREKDLLRDRIDNLLLVQKAKELNINVDAEVTKQLAGIQRENKIADQDKFQDFIRQRSGLPFEDFRQQMRERFMTQRLLGQEVGSKVSVPRAEAAKYYEEHKDEFMREERAFLSEILISTADKDPKEIPALEKKAKDLVERARKGEKFGDLAKANSNADTASDSGQVGSFLRKDMQPQISDMVFSQDRGYVTDPIKMPNGFLILRVDEKHTAGLASLDEVENEILQKLSAPKFDPAVRVYLTGLREQAFLEIREGFIDSGAAPGKDTSWRDPAQLKPETVTKEEVASQIRRKRLLWMLPLPGTKTGVSGRSSS
jgi:peptidyl-prolyl cis-trans isomerase SurA